MRNSSLVRRTHAIVAAIALSVLTPAAIAVDFEWDGGAGDSLWNSVIISGGVQTNWSPENVPTAVDSVILTGASTAGPVTIDLEGGSQAVRLFEADGVDGAYTLQNGVLNLAPAASSSTINVLLANNGGGELVVDTDILLSPSQTRTLLFQSTQTGDKVTVNGDVSTDLVDGLTTLMLTSRNASIAPAVEVSGVISDGAGQVALVGGFSGNLLDHQNPVRVTGANTFTGSVAVNSAVLEFDSIANVGGPANALGQASLADSVITLGNGSSAGGNRATLRYLGPGHTSDRVLRLTGGNNASGVVESSGSGPLVLTGGVTTDGSGQFFRLGGTNPDDNEFSGTIEAPSGGTVTSFVKEGSGKWILSGDSPGLDNSFVVAAGELVVSGTIGGAGPNVHAIDTRADATLTVDGGSITARGIINNGALDFRSGTITLNGSSSQAGGSFAIGTAGAGVLRLDGGDHAFVTVTLDGADDRIELNAGRASFGRLDNSVGAPITSNNTAFDLVVGAGGFLDRIDSGTRQFAAQIIGSGGYRKLGAGTIEFTQPSQHTYTGETRIEEGTLNLAGTSGLPISPTFIADGATLVVANNSGGDATGGLSGAGTVVTGVNAGFAVEPASGTFSFSGSITGPGRFVKRRAGTQRLSGVNTYTGQTVVDPASGRLEVVAGGEITATSGVEIGGQSRLVVVGGSVTATGDVAIATNGRLEVLSGSLRANAIDRDGVFLWTGGTIDLATGVVLQTGSFTPQRPFGDTLTLDAVKAFSTDQSVTLSTGAVLSLSGGSLTADDLVFSSDGAFAFDSGTLTLRNDQTLDTARLRQLGVAEPVGAPKTLAIGGVATIDAPLALAGGKLSAGQVVNPGNLILAGGELEVTAGDFTVAAGETVDAATGTAIDVTAGGIVVDGELNAINATLSLTGGLTNNGAVNLINSTVDGDLVNGTGAAATLLGSNAFGGDLGLSAASAMILGIDGGAAFDSVTVGGDATLDGVLTVSLGGGFTPAAGQRFEVVSAGSVVDNGLALAGSAAGLFNLLVGAESVVLEAIGGLPGDYNADGAVDAADYTVWRDGLGSTFTQADYAVWADNYGATAGASNAVPEPTALALGLLTACAALRRRGDRG